MPTGGIIPAALAVRGQILRDGHPIYVSAGTEAVVASRILCCVCESLSGRGTDLWRIGSCNPYLRGLFFLIFLTRLRQSVARRAVIVLTKRQDCVLRWRCGWVDGWKKGLS